MSKYLARANPEHRHGRCLTWIMSKARPASLLLNIRMVCVGLLLGLIILTAAFYRDFAYLYLSAGPIKVYITEVVLILVLALLMVEGVVTGSVRLRLGVAAVPVVLFCLSGVLALI